MGGKVATRNGAEDVRLRGGACDKRIFGHGGERMRRVVDERSRKCSGWVEGGLCRTARRARRRKEGGR